MGAAKVLVFAAVFVAAECLGPFFKRDYTSQRRDYCLNEAYQCLSPVITNEYVNRQTNNFSIAVIHIDELCHPILDNDECDFLENNIEAVLSVGNFICSDQGRELLGDILQNSECLSNKSIVDSALLSCATRNSSEEQLTRCQRSRITQECVLDSVTESCGQAAGEFYTEVSNRVISMIPIFGCYNDSSNENLKRGFDLFRKRFV